MDLNMKEKALEIIKKVQADPALLKEFNETPAKTIEKLAGINIPDFLEPKIEATIKEAMKDPKVDPMSVIEKFL